ncbi:unnamed protein product [Trichobilharzia szidati]|nr:unnamed protein product [Trichobilharzia szidati]
MTSIPRNLPLSILEELSMLFSDYFVQNIKVDDRYQLLNQIQWSRYLTASKDELMHYPLFPTFITPDRVFSESHDIWKDILLQWENALSTTRQELISQLLEQLYASPLFHSVYERLQSYDIFSENIETFRRYFRQIWFGQYTWDQMTPTSSTPRTCGFQHVYIGEKHGSKIKGLHYWKRYYILEKTGRLLLEKIHKIHPHLHISSLRFQVDNAVKPYGTIFFGLPMDFEMLIFFCAFLVGVNREVSFFIDGSQTTVVCYDVATQSDALATAFFKY